MSPRALICAAAAAVMACALPAAPGRAQEVEAAPRRMLSAHEQMAFRGIGRLDFGDGYCTATLFDDRHALTAAHCLFDEAGRRRPSAGMWFRAGLRDGTGTGLQLSLSVLASSEDAASSEGASPAAGLAAPPSP